MRVQRERKRVPSAGDVQNVIWTSVERIPLPVFPGHILYTTGLDKPLACSRVSRTAHFNEQGAGSPYFEVGLGGLLRGGVGKKASPQSLWAFL